MIRPQCDMNLSLNCEGELQQFGALLFGPPEQYESGQSVDKMHVCVPCYNYLMRTRGEN